MKSSNAILIGIAATLGLGVNIIGLQPQPPSNVLTPRILETAGAGHLPSNLTTLHDLVQYQQKLPLHQTVTITWDSLPGHPGPLQKSEADAIPLSGDFTLVKRTQHEPGPPGGTGLDVIQDSIVVVALTSGGEIRGLKAQGDRRTAYGEALPGEHAEADA